MNDDCILQFFETNKIVEFMPSYLSGYEYGYIYSPSISIYVQRYDGYLGNRCIRKWVVGENEFRDWTLILDSIYSLKLVSWSCYE